MRNVPTQSIEAIVDGVRMLAQYAREKALYEADCRIQAEMVRLRSALYQCDARAMTEVTAELHRSRCKLELLKREIASTPPNLREFLSPLVLLLEERVRGLRTRRQRMCQVNRGDLKRLA